MPFGADNFSQAMQWATEIYSGLKNILNSKGLNTSVGDEEDLLQTFNPIKKL